MIEELASLKSLGLELPSPTYIVGAIVFGLVGFVAWRFGRKREQPAIKWLGVALMFYPYAISETWLLYTVGALLCAAIYFARR